MTTARPAFPVIGLLVLALALGACRTGAPASTASPSATQSPPAQGSGAASPSPQPTEDLGPFACELPVTGAPTVPRAQISDVRVGTHEGYDRVVIEFSDGVPAFTLEAAEPPLLADASGDELAVEGVAFWRLVMRDASRIDPDGMPVFEGPTEFTPHFARLTELTEGGDFEAVSTWYFGLASESCVRVLALTDPARLVFDIGR